MPKAILRRSLAAITVGGLLAAGSVTAATPAQADAVGYLTALTADGITVYDPVASVIAGYRICNDLVNFNGGVVVYRIYNTFYDVTTLGQADSMLWAAVENLCPWHDHRGMVRA